MKNQTLTKQIKEYKQQLSECIKKEIKEAKKKKKLNYLPCKE